MTQSTSSNAVSTHTDATTTKHLAQKSNLGQFTLLSFLFHCLCDVTTWTRLFPVFKLCYRKAHLKETQGRIMDLNDKIAVVTQTLQQALSGLQSKIEEDTRKVKPVSLSPEMPECSIFPTIPCSMQLPERLHVFCIM